MTSETKTEIVVFVGAAAAFLYLWFLNRQNGAGTGLEDFPTLSGSSSGSASLPGPATFNVPAAVQGNTYAAPAGSVFNFGNLAFPSAATAQGGCGCAGPNNAIQFGGMQDLIDYLQPNPPPPAPPAPTPTVVLTPGTDTTAPDLSALLAGWAAPNGQLINTIDWN